MINIKHFNKEKEMNIIKILMATAIAVGISMYTSSAQATIPKSMCVDKVYDQGTVIGILTEITDPEEEEGSATFKIKNEDFSLAVLYDDSVKLQKYKGKTFEIEYQFLQVWDEENDTCARFDRLVKAKLVKK
jgi:hypothetical protein